MVFVELDLESNCLEIDAEGFVGVVAEIYLNGEDAAVEGGFLGEFFFVLGRGGPRESRHGKTFVGFEGCGFERVLSRRGCGAWRREETRGGNDGDGAGREVREDLVSHRVIIILSHIVA